jgi:hypothetical protein
MRRRSHCLVVGCSTLPVRCHSVSLAAGLRPLSRGGKVYRLDSHPTQLRTRAGRPLVRLDGIRRASTFYGFCAAHDHHLFWPIDKGPFAFDRAQAALYLLRALAHEAANKEMQHALAVFLHENSDQVGIARALGIGGVWAHEALTQHIVHLQDAIAGDRLSDIRFNAFVSHSPPPLVSSIVWFPDFDFSGAPLQSLPQEDFLPGLLGIFLLPHPEGSVCLLVWQAHSDWCVKRLLASIANERPPAEVGDALVQLQMGIAENVYFVPDWWESLPAETQEAYVAWWAIQADPTIAPDPNQHDRMRLPGVQWPVEYVRAE